MSQTCDLNIFFVLPEENKDAECSKDMYEAFDCVKQYRGKPKWVLPSFCLSRTATASDVFVFQEFKGPAFETLNITSAKLLGPRCMLTALSAGNSIPPGDSPVFTEGMRGLIVCCTGFDAATKKKLEERIKYMGGIYDCSLRSVTTHVIAVNTISSKAIQAFHADKHVMAIDWVEAVWNRSTVDNVRGDDVEFNKYKVPLFYNVRVTSTGMTKREKEKLSEMITSNGGAFSGVLGDSGTDILLAKAPYGEKFEAAQKWKIICVKPTWVYRCVELGKVVQLKDYFVGKLKTKASTPKKGDINLTANFSCMSAIANEDRNFTHLEETARSTTDATASQPPTPMRNGPVDKTKFTVSQVLDDILKNINVVGHFLDGCNIFLSGYPPNCFEKLKKIVNAGGATRFDDLNRSVTHIIVFEKVTDNMKESGAHLLPVDWLVESVKLRCPAPVEQFALEQSIAQAMAPPSPLSKQGARLLSRPEPRTLEFDPEPANLEVPREEDLLDRYNLSQQGDPIVQKPLTPRTMTSVAKLEPTLSSRYDYFQGLRFYLSDELEKEEIECSEGLITSAGGRVVSRKFSGISDYAVVPISGATLTGVTAKDIVNLFYLKDCDIGTAIVPIQYYHLPVTWIKDSKPLSDCVISVSKYLGSERDFVEYLVVLVGGIMQPTLARNVKADILKTTHLICPEPSGTKYEGALRWGVPIVHHDWLLRCAELGKRISEEPFLVGDSKLTSFNVTASSSRSKVKQSENANREKVKPLTERTPNIKATANAENASTVSGNRAHSNEKTHSNHLESPRRLIEREKEGTPKRLSQITPSRSIERAPLNFLTPEVHKDVSQEPGIIEPHVEPTGTPEPVIAAVGHLFETHIPSPRNKAIERLKNSGTPLHSSPESNKTMTPTSPYGAFYGNDNPSPATRKRLYNWMEQGPSIPVDIPVDRSESVKKLNTTPVSELLSRQLRLMMRKPEERPPDDSPVAASPAKRRNTGSPATIPSSTHNELLSGLQRMREIEESYTKSAAKARISSPAPRCSILDEPQLVIVAESQPHTEVGWDDPSEKYVALDTLEKSLDEPPKTEKVFMLSGLSEDAVEQAKKLIAESGGKISGLSRFDSKATHLIGGNNMTRAEKLMGSIAAGVWVLHPSYLEQLAKIKDVHAMKEEDHEWGNMQLPFNRESLPKNVIDCLKYAHLWRKDIRIHKKPPPFQGMKIILAVSKHKIDSFKRLTEAGGAEVIPLSTEKGGPHVYCICDMNWNQKIDLKDMARKNITCVSAEFISDLILRKETAVEDNLVAGFR